MATFPFDYTGPGGSGASSTGSSWHYADETDVQDLIGEKALVAISNEPDSDTPTVIDHDRVQRIGEWADAYMDARLSVLGYVTPLTGTDDATDKLMSEISAKLVAFKLNEPRMLLSLVGSRNASSIDTIAQTHWKSAVATLNQIAWKTLRIVATRTYGISAPAKVLTTTEAAAIIAAQ